MAIADIRFDIVCENHGVFITVQAVEVHAVGRGREHCALCAFDAVFVVGHVDNTVDDVGVRCFCVAGTLDIVEVNRVGRGLVLDMVEMASRDGVFVGQIIRRIGRVPVADIQPDAAFSAMVVGREIEGVVEGESVEVLHWNEARVVGTWFRDVDGHGEEGRLFGKGIAGQRCLLFVER